MRQTAAVLVIADVSGYSHFVNYETTSLLHAEGIISSLLKTMTEGMEFPLMLAKAQGDMAYLFAEVPSGAEVAAAASIKKQVLRMLTSFALGTKQLTDLHDGCICDACTNIHSLNLKVALHYGPVSIKPVNTGFELSGREVNLLSRLLTNSVAANDYVLMTWGAHELLGDFDSSVERRSELVAEFGHQDIYVAYPVVQVDAASAPPAQHDLGLYASIALRLFGRMPAAPFAHIPTERLSLFSYLSETVARGIKTFRLRFSAR